MKRGILVFSLFLVSILVISGCDSLSPRDKIDKSEDSFIKKLIDRTFVKISDIFRDDKFSLFDLNEEDISCSEWKEIDYHTSKGTGCTVNGGPGVCTCCDSCQTDGSDDCINCAPCAECSEGSGTPWYKIVKRCILYGDYYGDTLVCDQYLQQVELDQYNVLDPVYYALEELQIKFPNQPNIRANPYAIVEILGVDTSRKEIYVYLSSNRDIAGYQFTLSEIDINSVSGGTTEESGFTVSNDEDSVLSFALSGEIIPSDSEVVIDNQDQLLIKVKYDSIESQVCFDENDYLIIANTTAGGIPTDWGDCFIVGESGCANELACNYEQNPTYPIICISPDEDNLCFGYCLLNQDCAGECGGSAVIDECGICQGNGYSDWECSGNSLPPVYGQNSFGTSYCWDFGNACDCEGNILDCAGSCGGISVNTWCDDSCGVTGPVNDCSFVCGGSCESCDSCAVCDGDGSSCEDCLGIPNGNAQVDCAGECGGNAQVDCAGECGGNAQVDCAGSCEGNSEWGDPGCELPGTHWYEVCHSESASDCSNGELAGTDEGGVYGSCDEFCEGKGLTCSEGGAYIHGSFGSDEYGGCGMSSWIYWYGTTDEHNGGGWRYYGTPPLDCDYSMAAFYELEMGSGSFCNFEVQYHSFCSTSFYDYGEDVCYGPYSCGIRCCCTEW